MALNVETTTERSAVTQWLIERRTMPLWTLAGIVIIGAIFVICNALAIPPEPVLITFAVFCLIMAYLDPQPEFRLSFRRRVLRLPTKES